MRIILVEEYIERRKLEEFRYKFLNYLKTINYKKFIMPSFLLLINLTSFMFLFTMINRKEEKIESNSKITYDAPVIEEIEKTDEETQVQEEIQESNECSNDNEEKIFVDIKGSVKTPGVYELNINSRVIDAIKASGGLNKDANTSYINLSKKLEDGDVIIIYSNKEIEEAEKQDNIIEVPCDCSNIKNETNEEETSNSKININTASLEELQTLNGIGESKAALIIEYRTSNGKFKSIEELKNVKGISEKIFSKIKENITT